MTGESIGGYIGGSDGDWTAERMVSLTQMYGDWTAERMVSLTQMLNNCIIIIII